MSMNIAVVLLLTLVARVTVATAAEVVLSAPGTGGWRPLEFPKIARHTNYTVVHTDGLEAVKARADCAASALYLPVENVALQQTPRLHWRWKIDDGVDVPDHRVKAGDDFAARVYVLFRFVPEHASIWERLRHRVAAQLYGETLPGNAINYVWSRHELAGARWDSPFTSASKMVSRGGGPLAQWTEHVVDVAADYVSLFGHDPPPLLAVALMTDTDNSCQQATAYYADFRFLSR